MLLCFEEIAQDLISDLAASPQRAYHSSVSSSPTGTGSRVGDTQLPITSCILSTISLDITSYCCVLTFLAFMCSGELTVPAGIPCNSSMHLTPLDIAVDDPTNPRAPKIHLKSSKTGKEWTYSLAALSPSIPSGGYAMVPMVLTIVSGMCDLVSGMCD